MRQALFLLLLLSFSLRVCAQDADSFRVVPIPDSVWHRMQGVSFRPNPHIRRADLRYLCVLHVDAEGQTRRGELVCHRKIAAALADIFRQLYAQGYPIGQMRLPEVYAADDERQMAANNTSCFLYRPVSGTAKLSKHALGLAVDINPLYNPCVRTQKNGQRIVQPAAAVPYADRSLSGPYTIRRGDLCHRLFLAHGFQWGGSWRSVKDYQHFEFPN